MADFTPTPQDGERQESQKGKEEKEKEKTQEGEEKGQTPQAGGLPFLLLLLSGPRREVTGTQRGPGVSLMGIPSSDLPPVPADTTAGKPRSALRCQDSGAATTPRTPPPPLPPPAARKAQAGAPHAARPAGGHHPRATRAGRGAGAALPAPAAEPGNATTPIWMTEGFGGGRNAGDFLFFKVILEIKATALLAQPARGLRHGKGGEWWKKRRKTPSGGTQTPFSFSTGPLPQIKTPQAWCRTGSSTRVLGLQRGDLGAVTVVF